MGECFLHELYLKLNRTHAKTFNFNVLHNSAILIWLLLVLPEYLQAEFWLKFKIDKNNTRASELVPVVHVIVFVSLKFL